MLQNQKSIFRRRFDRCGRVDRSRCSKTVENSLAFAVYLPNEIDAFSFSGPEQILGDAPLLSPLLKNRFFSTPIRSMWTRRSMWTPRSIEVLKNGRKLHPATSAAPLSIIFEAHPPSRYTFHSFFFPALLLLLLLLLFLSFFLLLSLPLSPPLP